MLVTLDLYSSEPTQQPEKCGDVIVKLDWVLVNVWLSSRTAVYRNDEDCTYLILHGEVYVCDPLDRAQQVRLLHERYMRLGIEDFARSLNGSFLLLVIDTRQNIIHFITDRVGSKKAFYFSEGNRIYLASSLRLLPSRPIDPVGVTTYLQNSFIFSGRTVLADVSLLRRALIRSFSSSGETSREYWDYTFDQAGSNNQENDQEILAELMRAAVRCRIPSTGRIYISLSGGIDSRSVLGCLLEAVEDKGRLIAFSYGDPTDGDVLAAAKLAAECGIEHRLSSFSGDLALTIQRNGKLCEGMVGFYTHGIDGLFDAMDDFTEKDVLFVGDISVQRGKTDFRSLADVMNRIEIHSPIRVPAYYSLGDYDHKALQKVMEEDLFQLEQRVAHLDNLEDVHDYLYIDLRLSNMLLSWREYHASRFVTVVNPLLDNEIFHFYQKHTRDYRRNKFLHRATTASMFPELCSIPFSESGISNRNIHRQIYSRRLQLIELITSFDSRLDALLPKELLAIALRDTAQIVYLNQCQFSGRIRNLIDRVRRRYLRGRLSNALKASKGDVPSELLLPALGARRIEMILALRCFLS